jgi:asparagine synthase (glutamine-hydrolysing)
MPGITGVIGTEAKVLLKRMHNSIKHEDGYLVDEHFSSPFNIARVHLGIINPEPQPIFSEDEGLCIVMDGEIYDYDEEKERLKAKGHKFQVDNDPEFCLYLYEEYGEDFVKKLNGSFSLVIWDEKNQKLLIANDRHGSRPLYYAHNDGRLLFASEVKAILQDETFKKEINHEAVAEFFTFEYILENKTFFKGINLLPPASIFTYKNGQFSIKPYWDFEFVEEYDKPEDYYIDKLVSAFKKAVERRMVGNHRFGVSLSGGLDSRIVLGTIDKNYFPVHTFTYGIPGCDEGKIAKKVATKVGTIHKFIELKPEFFASFAEKGVWITDGMCNIHHLHSISTLEETKKDADIIFHGEGGDNFLGGLWLDDRILKIKSKDILHSEMYKKVNILFNDEDMRHLFSRTYYPEIAGLAFKSLERVLSGTKAKHPGNITDYFIFKNRITRFLNLVQTGTPRIQLEDRAPFCDNDFVDVALTIPPELRLNHRIYIKFLKQLCPDLAKIPYEKTGIRADAPIILSKFTIFLKTLIDSIKRKLSSKTKGLISIPITSGYPDYDEWMRNELKGFIEAILFDERTLNRGYFNREYILRIIEEHMSRRKNYSRQLSALITFELWQRLFVDEKSFKKGTFSDI